VNAFVLIYLISAVPIVYGLGRTERPADLTANARPIDKIKLGSFGSLLCRGLCFINRIHQIQDQGRRDRCGTHGNELSSA